MIGRLSGTVAHKTDKHLVLDVGGVGYSVTTTKDVLGRATIGEPLILFTHLAVRDDALELFGFAEEEELNYFHLLLSVPGIGPKGAINVLSLAPPTTLRQAVTGEDAEYLTSVIGLGRKNAEKIIVTLKDKLTPMAEEASRLQPDAEVLAALKTLGYSTAEARQALKKIPSETTGTTERVKAALQILGNSS